MRKEGKEADVYRGRKQALMHVQGRAFSDELLAISGGNTALQNCLELVQEVWAFILLHGPAVG